jgi:hypothetical protein
MHASAEERKAEYIFDAINAAALALDKDGVPTELILNALVDVAVLVADTVYGREPGRSLLTEIIKYQLGLELRGGEH